MQTLLKLLQDGRFHSGEELGAVLGISRSAVWKRLQHLEAEHGLQFHKVRGRGYRLASPLSLLDLRKIDSLWPVEIMPTVDSTNTEAMRRLAAGASTPFVLVAEQQTAGRGRRGRAWVSPYGENLYYSLAITVRGGARELEGLSLVVGLAGHIGMLLYRGYHHLREWGMLEVYLMGILVSIVKLIDMADLSLGIGLACFVALLFTQVWLEVTMSPHQVWEALGGEDDDARA
ncbi:paraquat-inducible protein A [Pseudomonas aeruginosa]